MRRRIPENEEGTAGHSGSISPENYKAILRNQTQTEAAKLGPSIIPLEGSRPQLGGAHLQNGTPAWDPSKTPSASFWNPNLAGRCRSVQPARLGGRSHQHGGAHVVPGHGDLRWRPGLAVWSGDTLNIVPEKTCPMSRDQTERTSPDTRGKRRVCAKNDG